MAMARKASARCYAAKAASALAALPSRSLVCVFSHGQFIESVRAGVTKTELDDRGEMLRWCKGEPPAIGNTEMVEFGRSNYCWQHSA